MTIYLTQEQSRHARDALAKAVYAAMFEWIVERTNECIEAKQQGEVMSEDRIFIGLLDIFGEHPFYASITLYVVWFIYVTSFVCLEYLLESRIGKGRKRKEKFISFFRICCRRWVSKSTLFPS